MKNEAELKKQAEKDFENEDYNLAYKLYAQLVSLYPKDPEYNYRLGVCMLFTEPDKKKPFSYLKIATANPKDAPKDAKFYLAKTYHVNYQFDQAIKLYIEYKQIGSSASIKKLQVDREIEACKNGKRLLSNLSDLVIISKKQLNEADYFRSYELKDIGGKLLVKPDDFRSSIDKKKKEKSVIYVPQNSNKLYYSSYGDNGDKGRDIYFVNKLPNGSWSKPQAMSSSINTEYDEDYPFLHPNGKTLYFSSKGHNSMGGYDVFKTTFDDATQTWSKPINLEFPINSPDDDILFVTDSLEKQAFFSTGRYSPYGKIDVLKINTERRPMDFAFLKGTVVKEDAGQSLKSKITVKNIENGEIVATYQAQDNGDYTMEIPNGGKFIFTVETPGIPTQSEGVQIPVAYSLKPYRQVISYDKKVLKIINYFDGQVADENYSTLLAIIEQKAKLEVNESDSYSNALKNKNPNATNPNAVNTNLPSATTDTNSPKVNTNKNVTNEQLLTLAKEDAKEAKEEAIKLKQEAKDAFGLATQKTAEALELDKIADNAINEANAITDVAKKNKDLEAANNLKDEAKIAKDVATTATNLAKKLEVDATSKEKEAELTNQYIEQLEAITKNKNNKEALTKLEQIQKELDVITKQKSQADELLESLKAEAELKQTEVVNSEKKNEAILSEIKNLKNEENTLQTDLENENDKSLKENIVAQIRELKSEIALKETDLARNNKKIETLQNGVDGINREIEIALKILNEKSDVVNTTKNENITDGAVIPKNTNTTSVEEKINYQTIADKYSNDVKPIETSTNPADFEKQNDILKDYNNDITSLIAKDKTTLSNTKDASIKKQLADDLKALEKQKTDNETLIANNTKKVNDLYSIANTNTNTTNTQSIVTPTNTNNEYVNQLTNLKNTLNNNSADATTVFNSAKYSEATSIKLKEDANKQFEIAKQNQSSLINSITKAETEIKSMSNNTSSSLLNEAVGLTNKAFDDRQLANTKTGLEKERLIKQATENEKLALDKKLEAASLSEKEHKATYNNNNANLENLQKLTGSKSNPSISQANMLAQEAILNFKQANNLRLEANAYPQGAAKLGGLGNAEEKETEALVKQQKAIDLLKGENPNYRVQNNSSETNPQNILTTITSQINSANSDEVKAYETLSKANQNELKFLTDKLSKVNISSNIEALNLKTQADKNKLEATNLMAKAQQESNLGTKAKLLLQANKLEILAINDLKQATELSSQINVSSTNTTNPNTVNTKTTTVNTQTLAVANTNTNSVNTKTTTVNTQTLAVANTNTNSVNTKTTSVNNANTNTIATKTTAINNANQTPISTTTNSIASTNTVTAITSSTINPQTNNTSNSNSIVNDANNLKQGLNDGNEKKLKDFNTYQNAEAIVLKEQANNKLNEALVTDETIAKKIDNVIVSANNDKGNQSINQQTITSSLAEAEKFNDKALALRQEAATKTGDDKTKLIEEAKKLEAEAVTKKVTAANQQKQLNEATFNANQKSLDDLVLMAKDKNIAELSMADMQINEAKLYFNKAKNLRQEANAYPTDAAKLGGYSNAEEKEIEALAKQEALLKTYKKYFSNYELQKPKANATNPQLTAEFNQTAQEFTSNNQNHIDALTILNNANQKEYKSRILGLPTLTEQNKLTLKNKAQELYKQSEELFKKANQSTEGLVKKKLLIEANQKAQESITLLNQIITNGAIATNTQNNNLPTNTNSTTQITPTNTAIVAENSNKNVGQTLKVKGLEIKPTNVYSASKPIPIDEKIADGLVFKVQVGAFKQPLPNETFKGITPIIAQTTPSGYIRYMAGNFEKYDNANAVKNDLQKIGYNDAFVVAYYNGIRVNLNEGINKAKESGQIINSNSNTTAGITTNANVPINSNNNAVATNQLPLVITELEQINGLLYTVQIGVYSKQVTRSQLFNLEPIYSEKLPNGLYRYTAGIYNQPDRLLIDKQKVVTLGVKDAFVSAYYNAKRIPFAEGKKLQVENQNLKLEIQNPIIFPFSNSTETQVTNVQPTNTNTINITPSNTDNNVNTNTQPINTTKPFNNGVTTGPTPTPENGVKTDDVGISFKVQIGAYKNQVPNDVASKFLNIKTWPVNNVPINGLYIYTIGNFNGLNFAQKLRDEAVSVGISDAFITVYKDGKKMYGAEAAKYLSK